MNLHKIMKLLKKIFFLPLALTLLIAVPSFIFVFYGLIEETFPPAVSYFSYILSAYAMIIAVTGTIRFVRQMKDVISHHPRVQKILRNPFVERFFSESVFRTEVYLYPGLMINFVYAGIKLFSGIRYRSIWFGTLAVYYILLAIMRFFLLRHVRNRGIKQQNRVSELKLCRGCGMILMILDWALTGIIILVVKDNSGFEYPGTLIYVMALYAFYAVITAIVNVIKFRKYESPAIAVAKVINLTAALVSMLSLETAMLTQFGAARDTAFRQRMTAATGAGVSIFVLGMAIYIIALTTNQINNLRTQEDEA